MTGSVNIIFQKLWVPCLEAELPHGIRGATLLEETPLVFVVDDEPVIAKTLATILQMNGFQVSAFTNPLDALRRVRSERPDLLLSDVVMLQLSGIELAKRVKDECPECKVLLFSGLSATDNVLKMAHQNGNGFQILAKPIHPTDLLRLIRMPDPR